MESPLLQVRNLKTYFFVRKGTIKAADGLSFDLERGETLGVVGESGCGKSVTALSIMRLISPPGRIVEGEILLKGRDILKTPSHLMPEIRGNEISMVFQEPMTSLNPVFTIGRQVSEAIMTHQRLGKKEALEKTIEMLELVGIASPEKRIDDYPHQLSGGQRQRVMIAMALSCRPSLLIADEPTTALDVTIQAQILDLILKLKQDQGTSGILITHDLGVIAEMAQRVLVMYAGKIVEEADVRSLFKSPLHPYTRGLLASIPYLRKSGEVSGGKRLKEIPGVVPSLLDLPPGCAFCPRCSLKSERCGREEPPLKMVDRGHRVRCWLC
ncbi:MAG: ABC transporter ATP-binding protein [Deltaproteobacteria bacterium]|nr:ABC transporter ATP-binding protein [Deltaproteobacteria bacterium]